MIKKVLGVLTLLYSINLQAQTTNVKVALDWYINPDHAPLLVAQTYGYFAKEGLNVTFIEPSNTSSARDLVLSHQADIGIDYQPETMLAINQGEPIKVFANLVPTPLSCMATLATSSINKLAQLQGKSIAYSGDPLEASLINAELKHAGVDPNSVKLIAVNMDLTQVLLSKQVDAVNGFMRNVEPIELKQKNIQTNLFYPEQNGIPNYAELVLITSPTANKQTLKKFMIAMNEAVATLQASPTAAWNKIVAAYPQDLASSSEIAATNSVIWRASLPYFTKNMTTLSISNYNAYNQFLLSNNLIKKPIPMTQYWWNISK